MPTGAYPRKPLSRETKRKIGVANSKPKAVLICKICKKNFFVKLSQLHRRKNCSINCRAASQIGKPSWNKGKHPPHLQKQNHPQWKGGRYVFRGYVFIRNPQHPFAEPNGYIREHRLVVERIIGRYLKPSEKTHHLGAKDDNRPQMLMAFSSHSAHMRFEMGGKVNSEEIIFDGRDYVE